MNDAREPETTGRRTAPALDGSIPAGARYVRRDWVKVPEIGLWFWVAKVLSTGMGETASDFSVHVMDPAAALACSGAGLAASLALQFAVKRYVPWIYWTAVAMVSVFGTMAADAVHVVLGVPYAASVLFFLAALAVIFVLWYRAEKTFSVHSVDTGRRETFYWATVLGTFALGTAAGDWTAYSLDLGYLSSAAAFAVLIGVAGLVYWRGWLAAIPAFWVAYIITRPLGASFADWTAVSPERGGLGWGTGVVTLVLAAFIGLVVAYLTRLGRPERHAPGLNRP
ncbi:hypothetical protein AB0280_00860 [Pseudarthrobacter sp902506025]|uniref:Membrane-anchored protein n=1 Tax=Pseudarthrobacter defluvii TaxID=410837 RepID=A0ABT9UFH6_9MICC|nr:hypothetical protein [Pseudarthrobacter defluvii]MDQ0118399.1 putative membrane-anchored protein [Pseudarthrobacter defluvii]